MIPIARPQVGDTEIENVVHVLRSGMLAGGRFGRAALDHVTLTIRIQGFEQEGGSPAGRDVETGRDRSLRNRCCGRYKMDGVGLWD